MTGGPRDGALDHSPSPERGPQRDSHKLHNREIHAPRPGSRADRPSRGGLDTYDLRDGDSDLPPFFAHTQLSTGTRRGRANLKKAYLMGQVMAHDSDTPVPPCQ